MIHFFSQFSPVIQALIATTFTWAMTALGEAIVCTSKQSSKKTLNLALGFAAGVMIAASFFSLLLPAIEATEGTGVPTWFPAVTGFLLGGGFLWAVDKFMPHLHMNTADAEGSKSNLSRSLLLVLAITLHNIPEGRAVGVAFGAAAVHNDISYIAAAFSIAIGIGIQNFPEGLAVSAPLRGEGLSRWKSFFWGQFSGLVEPVSAVIGAAAVYFIQPLLPYALSFAAGAMIFVTSEELIPEAESEESDLPTLALMVGFALMMLLDIAFS